MESISNVRYKYTFAGSVNYGMFIFVNPVLVSPETAFICAIGPEIFSRVTYVSLLAGIDTTWPLAVTWC